MRLKICTWNVHHFSNEKLIKETVSTLIQRFDLDIILLQEIVSTSPLAPGKHIGDNIAAGISDYNYHFAEHPLIWRGMKEGVATFSKFPITKPTPINLGSRSALLCTLRHNEKEFEVLNVHLSPLNSLGGILHHLEERKKLLELASGLAPASIIAGDMNIPPTSRFIKQLSSFSNTNSSPTWKRGKVKSYAVIEDKLDYILVGLGVKTISSQVVKIGPSDHSPLIAELEITS